MGEALEGGPTVSRRREVSHTSARSLLMTLLGEYVLPRDRPVWTSTLVQALGTFGVEEKSARQALARTAAEGWLVSERVGRRVRWSLTAQGRKLLTEGAERIYAFGRELRDEQQRPAEFLAQVGGGHDRHLLEAISVGRHSLRRSKQVRWTGARQSPHELPGRRRQSAPRRKVPPKCGC